MTFSISLQHFVGCECLSVSVCDAINNSLRCLLSDTSVYMVRLAATVHYLHILNSPDSNYLKFLRWKFRVHYLHHSHVYNC